MRQRIKIGGTWRALDIFMKVKGVWKPSNRVYIKINGKWALGQHLHSYSYLQNDEETHIAKCSLCGSSTTEEHVYKLYSTTEPTCEEAGEEVYLCEKCSQMSVIELVPNGHALYEWGHKAATCGDAGGYYESCYNCDYEEWVETEDATGLHNLTKGMNNVDPTCTEDGFWEDVCLDCQYVESGVIPALGHEWVDGVCSRCDLVCEHDWEYHENEHGTIVSATCKICGFEEVY